jgi:hypothetical protein
MRSVDVVQCRADALAASLRKRTASDAVERVGLSA